MEVIRTAALVTGFVLAMMLAIEYLNVVTRGRWHRVIAGSRWKQYVVATFLGATPGCLGAFAAVAMYTHGLLSAGALVGTMISTSGDEAFVMLALFPERALMLMGILWVLGIATAVVVDVLAGRRLAAQIPGHFELHPVEQCECFASGQLMSQWKNCIPARGILAVALGAFLLAVAAGDLGPGEWDWERVSLVAIAGFALFVVATVPDHFLEEHLWGHVVLRHGLRIFLWTLGALVAVQVLLRGVALEQVVRANRFAILVAACLVGLIPESGPHLVFVTMFAQGLVPFSVLLASSIVQDGHGMLPLLAHSRKEFLWVKGVNFACGLLVGGLAMLAGW